MQDNYGSDFISVTDEDGVEYELEVLTTLEYNGASYLAVLPADDNDATNAEIMLLKSIEEDEESILCAIEDEDELEAVNQLLMDSIFQDTDME